MKKYKPTISEEILLKDGYKKFSQEEKEILYQKKVTDEKGIKFFIDCYHSIFDFTNQKEPSSWWSFSVQFELENGCSIEIKTVQWFNKDGIYSGKNHLDVEDYLEKMWIANGKPYYELFEVQER